MRIAEGHGAAGQPDTEPAPGRNRAGLGQLLSGTMGLKLYDNDTRLSPCKAQRGGGGKGAGGVWRRQSVTGGL